MMGHKALPLLLVVILSGVGAAPGTMPGMSESAEPDLPPVAEEHVGGYTRGAFRHWIDADGDGCTTRAEVLKAESGTPVRTRARCTVVSGSWAPYWEDRVFTRAEQVSVDHLVALAEAWRSGAWAWDDARRRDFANDLGDEDALTAVSVGANSAKGDKDPARWLPKRGVCRYVASWVRVKLRWDLSADAAEVDRLREVVGRCASRSG